MITRITGLKMKGFLARIRRLPAAAGHLIADAVNRNEVALTRAVVLVLVAAVAWVLKDMFHVLSFEAHKGRWWPFARHMLLAGGILALSGAGLVYLKARLTYLRSPKWSCPAWPDAMEVPPQEDLPALTILVPYAAGENPAHALLSAALQTYPDCRVVLLPDTTESAELHNGGSSHASARILVRKVRQLLEAPAKHFHRELDGFQARIARGGFDPYHETMNLARQNTAAAGWFGSATQHSLTAGRDGAGFARNFLLRLQDEHTAHAAMWKNSAAEGGRVASLGQIRNEYRRLAMLFTADINSFDRARYANLVHTPGRIASLNTYIGLAGKNLRERVEKRRRYLEEAGTSVTYFHIPDAEYFALVDASGFTDPEYVLRMVRILQQPGNGRVALAHAFDGTLGGSNTLLNRVTGVAAALRQTYRRLYADAGVAVWSGDNGVIRKSALRDLATGADGNGDAATSYIPGHGESGFQQAALKLVAHGWTVHDHPERLVWRSAAPDFAAACTTALGWPASLAALPALFRGLRSLARSRGGLWQALLYTHHMAVIPVMTLSLLLVLAIPFPARVQGAWLGLAVLPLMILAMRDTVRAGYRWSDFLRAHAFGLLMLPMVVAGSLRSLHHALSGPRAGYPLRAGSHGAMVGAFGALLACVLLAYWLTRAGLDLTAGRWLHGVAVALSAAFLAYAMAGLINFPQSMQAVQASLRARRSSDAHQTADQPVSGFLVGAELPAVQGDSAGQAGVDPYVLHGAGDSQEGTRSPRILVQPRKPWQH